MTDERISKLPKWAQLHIARLSNQISDLEKMIKAGPDNSDTFIRTAGKSLERPLGIAPRIVFRIKDCPPIECHVNIEQTALMVMAEHGPLGVVPQASNCIQVANGTYR